MDRRGASGQPADTDLDAWVGADRAPYFFLSSAPDDDDIYITRFFDDLCAAVRTALGADDSADVGYLDPGGSHRPHWPADARAALATCRTFVALCSARYYLSGHCGHSWSAFEARLSDYHRSTGRRAPSLIPVLWSDGGLPVPDGFEADTHPTPDAEEARVLIRLSSHRPAYRNLVGSLARRIVDTGREHRLPTAPPGRISGGGRDAFARHPRRTGDADQRVRVSFTVIAGTREQMRPIRTNLGPYGERREDWAPYGPTVPQPVTDRAVALAAARRLGAEVVPLESLADRIDAAGQRNEIVVLLVDAWATQLDDLRSVLRGVGRRGGETVAILVATNHDDQETAANQGELRVAVLGVFAGRDDRHDLTFHPDVSTAERFDTDLAIAIVEAQSRLLRSVPDAPGRSTVRPGTRPILSGP